jgi:hypothetical protein
VAWFRLLLFSLHRLDPAAGEGLRTQASAIVGVQSRKIETRASKILIRSFVER